MLPRALLAVVAVLVVGWLGVLVRDERVGEDALGQLFRSEAVPERELNAGLVQLRDAELLNPDPRWELQAAGILVLHERLGPAARAAEAIVRREPDNLAAWALLLQATEGTDPARAAIAWRAIRRLNPFVSRRRALGMHGRTARAPTPSPSPPAVG